MAKADLKRVQRATEKLTSARAELEAAIRAAHLSGETYRDIAAACGMSHQRVWQVVNNPRASTFRGTSGASTPGRHTKG